ncbi:hypothetical protein SAMN05216196_108145 [Lutimaribacter pacificus]|uniref:Uncharacterized protein n=1 Tax=Lutimaribacter pacificus TaxID=391948 RepID=A0A1H0LV05_9RHOB|nr:hypothetical protein [Lutimaribacter pacificus]SDO71881.1 hypothetical protein SAMN05216196_108145 [Lutimaribacter pacificus]SHK03027.1 hypothetical protein SAMN05444142_10312 [Lutimaribacter pacificus]
MPRTSPRRPQDNGAAAANRLRERTDRGGTGDKVAFQDPAAAPLGTDDEAAGHPPTPEEVAEAERHEAGRAEPADRKPTVPELQNTLSGRVGLLLPVLALIALLLVALWIAGIW